MAADPVLVNTLRELSTALVRIDPVSVDAVTSDIEPILKELSDVEGQIELGTDSVVDINIRKMQNHLVAMMASTHKLLDALTDTLVATNYNQPTMSLSDIEPAIPQLLAQFQSHLVRRDAWTSTFAGDLGVVISELIAATAAFNQQGIEVAAREAFPPIARRDSSVYAGTEMLGVRITRKSPANATCRLSRGDFETVNLRNIILIGTSYEVTDVRGAPVVLFDDLMHVTQLIGYGGKVIRELKYVAGSPIATDQFTIQNGNRLIFHSTVSGSHLNISYKHLPYPLSIPIHSKFHLGGEKFFNRDILLYDAHQRYIEATLYEGDVRTHAALVSYDDFQVVRLEEGEFTVSDQDVSVTLASNPPKVWNKVDALWSYGPTDEVYVDRTTGEGYTELIFGDGEHGHKDSALTEILITYAVTSGSASNRNDVGLRVFGSVSLSPILDVSITGETLSKIQGGADEKSPDYYRLVGPTIFNSKNRVVSKNEYVAYTLNYPNVADVLVQPQRDIDPSDLEWMNTIRVCILPETKDSWGEGEWNDYREYIYARNHAAIDLIKVDPVPVVIDVNILVFIHDHAEAREIEGQVRDSIKELFKKKPGVLGRKMAVSDVVVKAKIEGYVDYVELRLNRDTRDVRMPDKFSYAKLGELDIAVSYTRRADVTEVIG